MPTGGSPAARFGQAAFHVDDICSPMTPLVPATAVRGLCKVAFVQRPLPATIWIASPPTSRRVPHAQVRSLTAAVVVQPVMPGKNTDVWPVLQLAAPSGAH